MHTSNPLLFCQDSLIKMRACQITLPDQVPLSHIRPTHGRGLPRVYLATWNGDLLFQKRSLGRTGYYLIKGNHSKQAVSCKGLSDKIPYKMTESDLVPKQLLGDDDEDEVSIKQIDFFFVRSL